MSSDSSFGAQPHGSDAASATESGLGTESDQPVVTAVVLAYGDEPLLSDCVRALLASKGVLVDVVLVDNGCSDGGVADLRSTPGLKVVGEGVNTGYSPGCNLGATAATGDLLALINADAVVEPNALAELAKVAIRPEVGIAAASVRLFDQPELLNSGGNEIHYLGFSWCGCYEEPAADHPDERDIFGAMGSAVMLRRSLWDELGGFEPRYFAYHEDAEISVRCWQKGLRVRFVPDAVVRHRYEFSRNDFKLELSERNRLLFVATLWQGRTLVLLAPAFVVAELGVAALAAAQGWLPAKVRGWQWLAQNRKFVLARRRKLQADRVVSDAVLAHRFATRLQFGPFPLPAPVQMGDRVFAAYWKLVRRWL